MQRFSLKPFQAPVVAVIFVLTMLSGMVYVVAQQNLRSNADDPQTALVQDAAVQLQNGTSPQQIISTLPTTQLDQTLSPYMVIYSVDKTPVVSSTLLNGKVPVLPSGVFDYAKNHTDDRVTWQPENGVRSAAIVRYVSGSQPGYILVGRSLQEIEKRESQLGDIIFIGWLLTLLGTVLIFWIFERRTMVQHS